MTSVQENDADTTGKDNGDPAPEVEDDDQGNDKGEAELEIQNNEDLEAFIEDDDEKDKPRRRSWDRTRGRDRKNSRDKDRDRDRDRERDRGKRRSRSGDRSRRSRSNDRSRRDQSRRDPKKSNKDIERDKERAKKDNDSKALAEKEKAIKTLLDSNNLVPPGTEEEAIQIIADKNQKEKDQKEEENADSKLRNRENRKRSPVHSRLGPRRSPRRRSKSPKYSPRRRSPSTDRRKRSPALELSTRKRSNDRDASSERREASRRRLRERRERERSRSRDRHRSRSNDRGRRSRSYDRRRSRSFDRRRRSRSYDRHSPRRRRSVSRSRSPTRVRRRSPFINELARQFSNDALRPGVDGPLGPMGGPPGGPYMPGGPPGGPLDPRMMPGGGPPPGLLSIPGAPGMPSMDVHSVASMHPGGPPMMHPGAPGGPPFGGFDPINMGFDPLNRGPPPSDYGAGSVMYNQSGVLMGASRPITPQPVPAPGLPMFPGGMMQPIGSGPVLGSKYSPNLRDSPERIRTPEPPIISDFKPTEKTSLSSLLEASVSHSTTTKDTTSSMPTFKGFKPEVIRQCERALRSLPAEDPRLNMKGRFFFDPNKKLITKNTKDAPTSNSILLRKGRTEIHWEEEFNQMAQVLEPKPEKRKRVITLQKICQTEELITENIAVQTDESRKIEVGIQVEPEDLMSVEDRRAKNSSSGGGGIVNYADEHRNNFDDRRNFDERSSGSGRPFEDRHDWNMRELFDHGHNKPSVHDNEDLRWSLNSNQNRSNLWSRPGGGFSPPRPTMTDHMHGNSGMEYRSMDMIHDRPGMDNIGRTMDMRDCMMDRGMMNFRERELEMEIRERDMRERAMDTRGIDMPRDRDFMPDMSRDREFMSDMPRDRDFVPDMPRDHDFMSDIRGDGGRPPISGRSGPITDFNRREPIDDFEMRDRLNDGFNRGTVDVDRAEPVPRARDSPLPVAADDGDDLEIIEERVFDRDSWQRVASGATLNNARGGAAMRSNKLPVKRPFRGGRIGSFRTFN